MLCAVQFGAAGLLCFHCIAEVFIAIAQDQLSECFADCAQEYEQQVPRMRQQTLQQLEQSRQQHM